jgi:hypothetical protein
MADVKISALPAGAAVAGTEPVPTVQSGVTVYVLISAIATYFRSLVNAFSKNQSVAYVALTDGATIAVDASLSNNFRVTLAGNRTLANPTNLTDGMVLNFRIKQDGTGSRTLAYGSKYKFPSGAPTLSTSASAVDLISGIYNSNDDTVDCAIAKNLS